MGLAIVIAVLTGSLGFTATKIAYTDRSLCIWGRSIYRRGMQAMLSVAMLMGVVAILEAPNRTTTIVLGLALLIVIFTWTACWWQWRKQLPRALEVARRALDERERRETRQKLDDLRAQIGVLVEQGYFGRMDAADIPAGAQVVYVALIVPPESDDD